MAKFVTQLLDHHVDLARLDSKCKRLLRLGLTVCHFTDGFIDPFLIQQVFRGNFFRRVSGTSSSLPNLIRDYGEASTLFACTGSKLILNRLHTGYPSCCFKALLAAHNNKTEVIMSPFDIQRMLIDEFPLSYLLEVGFRATFAFLAVFLFLKSSGRRGIRQLSLFELVVILTLGSAAGDVSFYHDVPLLPVAVVFLTLLLLYRMIVLAMTKSKKFEAWIDGLPVTVISNGMFEMKAFETLNMSNSELLMELRQQGVEHLGQVRLGLVETDGDISLYFFDEKDLCPGLSVLPEEHRPEFQKVPASTLYCCVKCGFAQSIDKEQEARCLRCGHNLWSTALSTRRAR